MASQIPANYDRAAEIARRDGLKVRPVFTLEGESYEVTRPSNGHTHTVTVLDGRLVCHCIASEHGRYCAHRAAVRIHLLADMAAKKMAAERSAVTAPLATPAKPAAKPLKADPATAVLFRSNAPFSIWK